MISAETAGEIVDLGGPEGPESRERDQRNWKPNREAESLEDSDSRQLVELGTEEEKKDVNGINTLGNAG
jgi:hypothetical protein